MAEINGELQNSSANQSSQLYKIITQVSPTRNAQLELLSRILSTVYCQCNPHNLSSYKQLIIGSKMKELMTEKASLNEQISNLDKRLVELSQKDCSDDEKKRRIRRSAKSIERHYKCPVQSCQKQYGKSSSEGSLNQHMKLKHPDVYAQTVKAEESSEYKNEQNEEQSELGQTNNNSN